MKALGQHESLPTLHQSPWPSHHSTAIQVATTRRQPSYTNAILETRSETSECVSQNLEVFA
jgi:hypothetical protein